MMKILSIVVPMYNVEPYIEQCLASFHISEISEYIEILVIDDGSQDGSSDIAYRFQEAFPGLYKVIVKKNGGHGSAVNKGIEEASGKYLKVVDGDDWVDKDAFIHLLEVLKYKDADMVCSNYYWYDQSSGRKTVEKDKLCPDIEYGHSYPANEVLDKTFLKMHAITYKTDILKKMTERLDENCFYVDVEYVVFPLPLIKTVLFIEDFVYQYRVGLSTQSMNIKRMQERCGQHERVIRRLLAFYRKKRNEDCSLAMSSIIARMIVSQYKIYLSFPNSHKNHLVAMEKELISQYPEIYEKIQNKVIRILRKSRYYLYGTISCALRYQLGEGKA